MQVALHPGLGHKGPLAVDTLQQTVCDQPLHRPAHRGPGEPELRHQLPLRGDRLPRSQVLRGTAGELPAELDVLGHRTFGDDGLRSFHGWRGSSLFDIRM